MKKHIGHMIDCKNPRCRGNCEVGVSETAGCSTADDFEKWLSGFQGLMASNPDILYFDSYEDILKERLKAAFISGAASIACKP